MLLLTAVVVVLVIAVLASFAAWAVAAHLNADGRGFGPTAATNPVSRRATRVAPGSRIVLPTPLD